MELISSSGGVATLKVSRDELGVLTSCLGEAMEALEDWEFQSRVGVDRETVQILVGRLNEAYKALGTTPSVEPG